MAIAKMNKLKLISLQNQKDTILKGIQSMQSVELIDISAYYADVQAMHTTRRDELDSRSKQLSDTYEKYQDHLQFLVEYLAQPKLLDKLRTPKQMLSLSELEKEVATFNKEEIVDKIAEKRQLLRTNEQALATLKEEEEFLSRWRKLDYVPNISEQFDFVVMETGTVPQSTTDSFIQSLRESSYLFTEEIFQTREEHGITVVYDKNEEADAKRVLEESQFSRVVYPFSDVPEKELVRIATQRKILHEEIENAKKQLRAMGEEEWALKVMIEEVFAQLQRVRGQKLMVDERHLFVLEGWLEASKVSELKEVLEQELNPADFALVVEEVQEDEVDSVPIVLKNNKFVAPFETITAMYSLPKYNEMDPTPFLMPFYLVFFGMMMADAGYGLVMFLVSLLALKFFHLEKGMKKSLTFFHLLSYPTMVWGLIYGSFFGLELPIVLLSTMDDVNTILIISVVFGIIQILLGLGLKAYLLFRDKDPLGAIADGVGWITIFVGLIILLIASMVFPNVFLANIGKAIAIAGVIVILIATAWASENKGLGFGLGLYNLYGMTGYIGDIVSYTRLMALGVSGGSIAMAFNMIIEFLPGPARVTIGILLFVVLHLINLGLSMLSAYVHGARLIFVEFFGKFYEGGGKAINPLKTSEEYIDLKK